MMSHLRLCKGVISHQSSLVFTPESQTQATNVFESFQPNSNKLESLHHQTPSRTLPVRSVRTAAARSYRGDSNTDLGQESMALAAESFEDQFMKGLNLHDRRDSKVQKTPPKADNISETFEYHEPESHLNYEDDADHVQDFHGDSLLQGTLPEGLTEESVGATPSLPCPICARKFMAQDRLDKHINVCAKSQKTRKVFDMSKARVSGTEMEQYALKPQKTDKKVCSNPSHKIKIQAAMNRKSNWREKHDNFIRAIRAAREPVSSSKPVEYVPDVNPDYVQCNHCLRRFNEDAAARHIPICNKDSKLKSVARGRGSVAPAPKERGSMLKKRTSYKPPTPGKAR